MKKLFLFIIVFVIIGFFVGYGLFGKIAGEYISIKYIFHATDNQILSIGRKLSGLDDMKQNIIICAAAGGVLGLLFFFGKKIKF